MMASKRRGSPLLSLALVFLGVMFLLINLNVVDDSIWSEVVRYWPVLLILVGIDTLLRRSSVGTAWGAILAAALVIAVGFSLFYLYAPGAWSAKSHTFQHPLGTTRAANIVLSCPDCAMDVGAQPDTPGSSYLISGSLTLRRDEYLTETVWQDQDTTHFRLESDYRTPSVLWGEERAQIWKVDLDESVLLALSLATDGDVNVDLSNLLIESCDISSGDAPCTITLPRTSNATVFLSGDRIEVRVPQGVGVHVEDSVSSRLSVPPDYVRTDRGIVSPDYETAAYRTDIALRPGCEWVEIGATDAAPSPQAD